MIWTYVFASLLAFLLTLYGTPIARAAAVRYGVVDRPDGILKIQSEPVPYFGGLSIYLAVLIPLCLFYTFDARLLAILLAGTLVLLLGLIDDFGALTPAAKFIGQIVAATVLIKGDVIIRVEVFPLHLNLILTLLWVIGMANAMNIIDIMDGLAPGVALIGAVFLFVVAVLNQHYMIAVFTATLIGSLAGFLRYNFHPASIYLGDTGSMFLGIVLGALAIIGDYTDHNKLAYFNPLLIFGVAIFDTLLVMILRFARKRSMFLGSKDHFAVRLKAAGWTTRRIVLTSYLISAALGGTALLNMHLDIYGSMVLYCLVLVVALALGWGLARVQVYKQEIPPV